MRPAAGNGSAGECSGRAARGVASPRPIRRAFRMTPSELSDIPSAASHGRNEAERRQRHGGEVVEQRPALVLAHDGERALRDVARGRDRVEAPALEHDVAARLRQLRAFRERDRDIGAGQHRGVVDAVTDREHARARRRAAPSSQASFSAGSRRARQVPTFNRAAMAATFDGCVAARDEHCHALRLQRVDRGAGLGPQSLADAKGGDRPAVVGQQHGVLELARQWLAGQGEIAAAEAQRAPVDRRAHA